MRRGSAAVAFILIMSYFCVAVSIIPLNVRATVLYVGGGGPGNYTTIQEAINIAFPGDTVFVFSGTYKERITIDKTLSLVGENRVSTIIDGSSYDDAVNITANWVNFTGFTLMSNSSSFTYIGIELYYVQNCRINDNIVWRPYLGVHLFHSDDNDIADNVFSDNGYGIFLQRSMSNTISGNAESNNTNLVRLEYSDKNTISNNVASGGWRFIYLYHSNDSVISGNVASDTGNAIGLESSAGNTLTNNVMTSTGILIFGDLLEYWNTQVIDTSNTVNGKPVRYLKNTTGGTVLGGAGQAILANCQDIKVEGQDVSNGTMGIEIGFSSNNIIDDNVAFSNFYMGIHLSHSEHNTISRSVTSSGLNYGIFLTQSDANTMIDNTMVSNGQSGIYLFDSENNTIDNNTANLNDPYGIVLSSSHNNTVINNTASANDQHGIRLRYSDYNTVTGNFMSTNRRGLTVLRSYNNLITGNNLSTNTNYGAYIDLSDDNRFYHNVFWYNSGQARDGWSNNEWDNGYPSGGNYWTDYFGLDEKSGPNQDLPGFDGIGDTPYFIPTGDRKDRYPYMSPDFAPSAPSPPSVPLNPQATPGDQQVTLTWDEPTFDGGVPITNYKIYRGTSPGAETFLAEIGNVLTFTDTGLTNGQTYYYQVSAVGVGGEGPRSQEVSAIPVGIPGAPRDPFAIAGNQRITLHWSPPLDDGGSSVSKYLVYRATTSGSLTFLIELGNVLTFTDLVLVNGQTYYYAISAKNSIGEGAQSIEVNATPSESAENQPPFCTITSPEPNQTITGTVTISGTASDPDGTVLFVEIRINEGAWIQASGTSDWSYGWNTKTVPNAEHTIHARSFDGENYSDEVEVVVLISNPDVPGDGQDWLPLAMAISLILVMVLLVILVLARRGRKGPGAEEIPESLEEEKVKQE
jgi:parallel beta-helix repeat protein